MKRTGNYKKKHGMYKTRIYHTYWAMIERCTRTYCKAYEKYGAKGIKVCDEWLDKEHGFETFYEWAMQNGYSDDLTLDRIDSKGNYEPSNCRWATYKTQNNNISRNRLITYNGKTQTMAQWADELGIPYQRINTRINVQKRSVEEAFYPGIYKSGVAKKVIKDNPRIEITITEVEKNGERMDKS